MSVKSKFEKLSVIKELLHDDIYFFRGEYITDNSLSRVNVACLNTSYSTYLAQSNFLLNEMKGQLGEDFKDMEKPDYHAMMYCLRNIKEILK